tara:strand:- start:2313 stop:3260 length:948 start_codon:yes stop_codon:yes gene_type:complete
MKAKTDYTHSTESYEEVMTGSSKWMVQRFDYDTFYDLITNKIPALRSGKYILSSREGSADFTGTRNWDAAEQLFTEGWEEGLQKVAEISEIISNTVKQQLPEVTFQYDVTGGMVDVGTLMSGVPECMLNFNEQETSATKYVDIHVNGSVSCGVSTTVIENKGAAIMALVDALEVLNYRTRVVLHDTATRPSLAANHQYTVKDYDEPLERDRMAFLAMHPSSFRRLGFTMMEFAPKWMRDELGVKHFGGYGAPAQTLPSEIFTEKPDVILHGINTGEVDGELVENTFRTTEDAIKWVLDILKGLSVPLADQIEMND